ncbi:hypothetical protein BHE74_00028125 [Ensete ventricosum]|nr:hypothetical protein BHE74_00028125 [Ensete ventricosum]
MVYMTGLAGDDHILLHKQVELLLQYLLMLRRKVVGLAPEILVDAFFGDIRFRHGISVTVFNQSTTSDISQQVQRKDFLIEFQRKNYRCIGCWSGDDDLGCVLIGRRTCDLPNESRYFSENVKPGHIWSDHFLLYERVEVAREVLMNYDGKERLTAEAINEQMVQDVPINEAGKGLSAEAIPETVKAGGNDVPPEQDQHHLETLTPDMSRLDILVEIAASIERIAGPSADKDASKIAITTPTSYLTVILSLQFDQEILPLFLLTYAGWDVANQSFEKDVDHKPANPGMTYYFRRKKRQPDLQKAIARDQAS